MTQFHSKLPKILVTGATGKTGSAVVAQLREQHYPVRALVRTRDTRSDRLERLGAEVVVADLFDPEQLRAAIQGTTRAYYVPLLHPFMIQSAAAFATAARDSTLEVVVQMSQWLSSPAHPALMTRQTWLVDQLFSMIPGVAQTILNPGYFADNYLRLIGFAAQLGLYPNLTGDSQNAPPSNEDMARVAVAVLMNPEHHAGKTYRPTGPALLSADDIARTLSVVFGRPVRRADLPMWVFLKAARQQGVAPYDLSVLKRYIEDHRQGAFAVNAPTSDVLTVTGRAAESFETTVRRYAALPEAARTPGHQLRALLDFLRTPFGPGYNLNRYEQAMGFPVPPSPRYALNDAGWERQHRPAATPAVL
ncbi:NmrA family NAD(P)-binding protein [Deinococcus ruber]|uniref:NAD(P)-dependent oxidoreductase n=1 Tax=Deinococcus ruber TaxID=1848197 RepID=A0A918CHG6_9DEIO|nr:NmrA family NAD(P)-binding protein [Deinococcus ruber]GGR22134.1 NAD(P)-dependent oxidoreductase [Deinococcus ruber]